MICCLYTSYFCCCCAYNSDNIINRLHL